VLAKEKLKESQKGLEPELAEKFEKMSQYDKDIGERLAKAEQAGAEGNVELSMKFMHEVEGIRSIKMAVDMECRNAMPPSHYQQQKLRVCEICSAYLGANDHDKRLTDHYGGKLHLGFIKIRQKLADLMENFEERKEQRRQAWMAENRQGAGPSGEREGQRGDYHGHRGGGGGYRGDRNQHDDRHRHRRRSPPRMCGPGGDDPSSTYGGDDQHGRRGYQGSRDYNRSRYDDRYHSHHHHKKSSHRRRSRSRERSHHKHHKKDRKRSRSRSR